TVSSRIPSPTASLTVCFIVLAPRRWPSSTGSPRSVAQRPLPSMMIAPEVAPAPPEGSAAVISDGQDLLFLALDEGVDLPHRRVRPLLPLGLCRVLSVLADVAVLFHLAHVAVDVAADVAARDAALLGDAVDHLD